MIQPRRHRDERGWFEESFVDDRFRKLGIAATFRQDNHSYSKARFTLRGLHFQTPPHQQDKLIRCVRGRIFDVAVDLRRGSPTFGRWVGAELSADDGRQLFIPSGFAHGFLTLEADCEVTYKVSNLYEPSHEGGIRWDDPTVAITWPLPENERPTLAPRDDRLPSLTEFDTSFAYDGRPLGPIEPESL
jgi:dTDP-4-dehydrorhamnose 3,5-epimerase